MVVNETRAVLIADDEAVSRENLERLLATEGYEPVTAANGQEALERAAEQEFGVVLLDLKMPVMSGMEALPKLLTDYPDTSVIIVTAVVDVETAVEAMKLGAYDYILKPISLDDVLLRVQKALERRRMALQLKNYHKDLEERLAQQAKELRALTAQTIQALIHEETMARQLEAKGRGSRGLLARTDIKEFGAKIVQRLSGGES